MDHVLPDNIVLTGFMGTGKTTVGRLLAGLLDYESVDTDAMIVEHHGPIPQIFEAHGEKGFRAIERQLADELAGGSGRVISTGGRMMLDPESAAALGATSRVFCLVASAATIAERLLVDGSAIERPLLAGPDPRQGIQKLLAERADGYAKFEQVATDGRTPTQVAAEIYRRLTE
jgi:shikimate kinase